MYHIIVTGAQPTNREQIALSCEIEQSDDGVNWTPLEGAPTTLTLPLAAVIGTLRDAITEAAKRTALQVGVSVIFQAGQITCSGKKLLPPTGFYSKNSWDTLRNTWVINRDDRVLTGCLLQADELY